MTNLIEDDGCERLSSDSAQPNSFNTEKFMLKRFKLRSQLLFFLAGIVLPVALFVGCGSNNLSTNSNNSINSSSSSNPDVAMATEIAQGIAEACPTAELSDEKAQQQCAEKLANFDLLRKSMSEDILWGQQKEPEHYNPTEHETTVFNPLVWRRTYLSTFMINDEPKVEEQEGFTIIHLPVVFRKELDMGAFPYPFWHSPKKWEAYQQATEVLLVMKEGKIKGALRSYQKDQERPLVEREWDGQWMWEVKDGKQEPKVTLYTNLFSQGNPHVKTLDAAYRAFEVEMRQHSCMVCHSPDNSNEMKQLLLLNYPNQALTLRHENVSQIEDMLMPPPAGIADDEERQKLLELAKAFAEAGDEALAYEGEQTITAADTSTTANGA